MTHPSTTIFRTTSKVSRRVSYRFASSSVQHLTCDAWTLQPKFLMKDRSPTCEDDTEVSLPLHPRQPQRVLTSKFSYLCSASSPLPRKRHAHPLLVHAQTCQLDKFHLKHKVDSYKSRLCSSEHVPRWRTDKLRNDRRPKDVNSAPQSAGKLVCRISTTDNTMCFRGMGRCELIELFRPWHVETSHRLSCKSLWLV